jgi:hypothetical protein
MAGGAPAGIKMPTPDLGWRTKSTRINTTTIHGKRSTTPSGIEMLELPFKRSGRRKKANLEEAFDFVLTSSTDGRLGAEGKRFRTLCTKPIGTVVGVDFLGGRDSDIGVSGRSWIGNPVGAAGITRSTEKRKDELKEIRPSRPR